MSNSRALILSLVERNVYYVPPKDKERLLYDFYTAELGTFLLSRAGVGGEGPTGGHRMGLDDASAASFTEAKVTILKTLKEDQLNALYFAICAEFRHVFDNNGLENIRKWLDRKPRSGSEDESLGDRIKGIEKQEKTNVPRKWMAKYWSVWKARENDRGGNIVRIRSEFKRKFDKENTGYAASFEAAEKANKEVGVDRSFTVQLALDAFDQLSWGSSYGGSAWAQICEGWLRLNSATKEGELFTAIDHVFDLQHNTDTVFNKIASYNKDGYGWLKKALDFKAREKDPYKIIQRASSDMRAIVSRIAKAAGYTRPPRPGKGPHVKVGDKWKVEKFGPIKAMHGGAYARGEILIVKRIEDKFTDSEKILFVIERDGKVVSLPAPMPVEEFKHHVDQGNIVKYQDAALPTFVGDLWNYNFGGIYQVVNITADEIIATAVKGQGPELKPGVPQTIKYTIAGFQSLIDDGILYKSPPDQKVKPPDAGPQDQKVKVEVGSTWVFTDQYGVDSGFGTGQLFTVDSIDKGGMVQIRNELDFQEEIHLDHFEWAVKTGKFLPNHARVGDFWKNQNGVIYRIEVVTALRVYLQVHPSSEGFFTSIVDFNAGVVKGNLTKTTDTSKYKYKVGDVFFSKEIGIHYVIYAIEPGAGEPVVHLRYYMPGGLGAYASTYALSSFRWAVKNTLKYVKHVDLASELELTALNDGPASDKKEYDYDGDHAAPVYPSVGDKFVGTLKGQDIYVSVYSVDVEKGIVKYKTTWEYKEGEKEGEKMPFFAFTSIDQWHKMVGELGLKPWKTGA